MKLIDETEVPATTRIKTEKWLKKLKQIPEGKAWEITTKDVDVSLNTIKTTFNRYIREGLLPQTYKVVQRKKGNNLKIYVIHSTESKE